MLVVFTWVHNVHINDGTMDFYLKHILMVNGVGHFCVIPYAMFDIILVWPSYLILNSR